MIVKDLLISCLEQLGYVNGETILQQGSIAPKQAYPDSFFTFWNDETTDINFMENQPFNTVWQFNLSFYSNNPDLVNTELERARPILKNSGFVVVGKGADAYSDEPTHTGRDITLLYVQNN